jgi:hypothetical protein
LQFLGPIAILALALTLRYIYKKNYSAEWMRIKLFSLQIFRDPRLVTQLLLVSLFFF